MMNSARYIARLPRGSITHSNPLSTYAAARNSVRTMRMMSSPSMASRQTRRVPLPHYTSRGNASRLYSSEAPSSQGGGGFWSPLFTVLLVAGVGVTAYGLYDLYGTLTMWPSEVRSDLRNGLKTKYTDDLATSAAHFQRAWETAKSVPIALFKSQPYLKTSGIAICLGEVLEGQEKSAEAYAVYADVLKQLQDAGIKDMSGPEKMRAVALAYKLAELCETESADGKRAGMDKEKAIEEEEKWLTFGVETILKNVLEVPALERTQSTTVEERDGEMIISELGLPDWVSTVDIAAPFEALGTFYSKAGKLEFAMPLMLQAISVLIPPAPQESTPEDRCRGAQLMTSVSEMIIRNKLSREAVQQAEQWAMKGLEVVVTTRKASKEPIPTCEVAYAVQLFNMASLRAIGGDIYKAKDLFARSANQAKVIGYQQLVDTSNQAIEELNSRTAPKTT